MELPLDGNDELIDTYRCGLLFVELPCTSRSMQRMQPSAQWNTTDYLLWLIEFHMRSLLWSMMDSKGRAKSQPPKPLPTPAKRAENFKHKENAEKNKKEIQQILGMKGLIWLM